MNREEFEQKLKSTIFDVASKWLYWGSCVRTMREVLKRLRFTVFPYLKNHVDRTIQWLKKEAKTNPNIQILSSHEEAQEAANKNTGEYVVFGMVANYKYPVHKKGGSHHVALILPGIMQAGGGGVKKKEHIFMPIAGHFNWNYYGHKDFNCPEESNKFHMVYFLYGNRDL